MNTTTYVFLEKQEKYHYFLIEKSALFGALSLINPCPAEPG